MEGFIRNFLSSFSIFLGWSTYPLRVMLDLDKEDVLWATLGKGEGRDVEAYNNAPLPLLRCSRNQMEGGSYAATVGSETLGFGEEGGPDSRKPETDNNAGSDSQNEPENEQSNESKNEPENNKGKSRDDYDQENGSETERQEDQGKSYETAKSPNTWEGSDAAEDMDDKYYHTLKDKQLWGDFNYNSETDQGDAETSVASSSRHCSPKSEQEPEYDADVEDFDHTAKESESDSDSDREGKIAQEPENIKVSQPSHPEGSGNCGAEIPASQNEPSTPTQPDLRESGVEEGGGSDQADSSQNSLQDNSNESVDLDLDIFF